MGRANFLFFPTNNVQFELNDSALERYLIAVHGMTPGSGVFAQSNGLSRRAGRQQVGGVPLDPLKTYRVATSAIAAGDTGMRLANGVSQFIASHQVIDSAACASHGEPAGAMT